MTYNLRSLLNRIRYIPCRETYREVSKKPMPETNTEMDDHILSFMGTFLLYRIESIEGSFVYIW